MDIAISIQKHHEPIGHGVFVFLRKNRYYKGSVVDIFMQMTVCNVFI